MNYETVFKNMTKKAKELGWTIESIHKKEDELYIILAKRQGLFPERDYVVSYYDSNNKGFFWTVYDLTLKSADRVFFNKIFEKIN